MILELFLPERSVSCWSTAASGVCASQRWRAIRHRAIGGEGKTARRPPAPCRAVRVIRAQADRRGRARNASRAPLRASPAQMPAAAQREYENTTAVMERWSVQPSSRYRRVPRAQSGCQSGWPSLRVPVSYRR